MFTFSLMCLEGFILYVKGHQNNYLIKEYSTAPGPPPPRFFFFLDPPQETPGGVNLLSPLLGRWRSRLESSPRMRKVGCTNPSRDRLMLFQQVMLAPLLNAQQQL